MSPADLVTCRQWSRDEIAAIWPSLTYQDQASYRRRREAALVYETAPGQAASYALEKVLEERRREAWAGFAPGAKHERAEALMAPGAFLPLPSIAAPAPSSVAEVQPTIAGLESPAMGYRKESSREH